MRELVVALIIVPFGAVLLGAGVLAMRIADTWTTSNTTSAIVALSAVCGISLALGGLVFGAFVGAAFLRRQERHESEVVQGSSSPGPRPGRYLPAPGPYGATSANVGSYDTSGMIVDSWESYAASQHNAGQGPQ